MSPRWSFILGIVLVAAGCGTQKSRLATEQLLMSDAVDRSIAVIDFRALSGRNVYFDTTYIQPVKGAGFVNAEYVISSIRQQMVAAGLRLQEKKEDADYVVEGRLGALGIDGHEVVYGIPASNGLSSAAVLVPNAPAIPAIPEIAVAKRHDERGAAKVGLFAYHRETREPVWQSGISLATSNAKNAWILGAGPLQYGTIYNGTRFAGSRVSVPLIGSGQHDDPHEMTSYFDEVNFERIAKARRERTRIRGETDADLRRLAELPELAPLDYDSLSRLPPEAALPMPSATLISPREEPARLPATNLPAAGDKPLLR